MKRLPFKKYVCTFLLLLILLSFCGCSSGSEPLSETGFYFDTVISVTIYGASDRSLLEDCFSIAATYENMFSRTIEGSDIWNINHSNGAAVPVSDDTLTLIDRAVYYARLTDGRIDPTVSAVKDLWDFSGNQEAVLPNDHTIREALTHVNYENIIISGNTVCLTDKQASVDLGFIAKGFIADRMIDYLKARGVKSALINLGGNVAAIGNRPDGTAFRIGIQKPFSPAGTSAAVLPVSGLSAVTSGNYERYFEKNGQIYHHILDAKTGYPVWNNLSAVTIISASSTEGDALSTTCFLLGLTEGMALIESLDNTEALFITSDGSLHFSSGLSLPD